jgi:alkylglycerol monooxygenase
MSVLQLRERSISRTAQTLSALQFIAVLAGTLSFLFLPASATPNPTGLGALGETVVCLLALGTGLWCAKALLQGRITVVELLYIDAAVLATSCAALGLDDAYHLFKPLPMLLAMTWTVHSWARGQIPRGGALCLLLAQAASLTGDVFLMLPGHFLQGLLSFLAAHLAYLALLRRNLTWLPNRRLALLVPLLVGGLVYAVLWQYGLPTGLRGPVGAYVVVIALMAAQALGRAAVRQTAGARLVGIGAAFFMVSDSVLAINTFAIRLPLAALWVLSTYFLAQWLIVRGWLRSPD